MLQCSGRHHAFRDMADAKPPLIVGEIHHGLANDQLAFLDEIDVGDIFDAEFAIQFSVLVLAHMFGKHFLPFGRDAVPFGFAELVGEEIVGLKFAGLDMRP